MSTVLSDTSSQAAKRVLKQGSVREIVAEKASGMLAADYVSETSADGVRKSIFRAHLHQVLHTHLFENITVVVILASLVVSVLETDWAAKGEHAPTWMSIVHWTFLGMFVLEVGLRLFVLRAHFWHTFMNIFDFVVVGADLVMSLYKVLVPESSGMATLTVLRLFRVARAAKALKMFPEIKLMMAGIAGACSSIFWGSVLLFFVLMFWSVLAVQFIHPLNQEVAKGTSYDGCDRCARAYESTFQACLTFTTQIVAGDSWSRETVPIIEAYPASGIFFISVLVSLSLCILNLILGLVVNVATETRDNMAGEEAERKAMQKLEAHNRLLKLTKQMDADNNGELSFSEVEDGFENNDEFHEVLSQLGVTQIEDVKVAWTMLDVGRSDAICPKEFVRQIYKMKGSPQDYMLAYVKFYVTEIRDYLAEDIQRVHSKLNQDFEAEKGQTEMMKRMETGLGALQRSMTHAALEELDEDQTLVTTSAAAVGIKSKIGKFSEVSEVSTDKERDATDAPREQLIERWPQHGEPGQATYASETPRVTPAANTKSLENLPQQDKFVGSTQAKMQCSLSKDAEALSLVWPQLPNLEEQLVGFITEMRSSQIKIMDATSQSMIASISNSLVMPASHCAPRRSTGSSWNSSSSCDQKQFVVL